MYCIVSHCITLCKSNFLIWYLIELSRNSGGFRNSWRLLKVLSHSITFFHSLFQIMTNMEAFWKCYCFLQGLFTAWEMKQGLIVSCGNIAKLCLCRFVLCGYFVMWPSVMYVWWVLNPNWSPICVCEIYTKFGRCSKITWSGLCTGNSLTLS